MARELTAQEVYDDCMAGFGEDLRNLLLSPGWSDLMINSDGRVFIDRGDMEECRCRVSQKGLISAALTLASYSHKNFNNDAEQSLVAILPILNLRVVVWNQPCSEHVSAVFRRPFGRLITPEELVEGGTITETQLDAMRGYIMKHSNIIISGGTGSGKTTLMNSFLTLIDPRERLFLIEDTPELQVAHTNVQKLTVNAKYTYTQAIADSLRGRPTRIIVGECRQGDQTMQMLKAWNTGHPGGLTTIHANSCEDVIARMEQLCGEVSVSSQRSMIESCVDVILQMERDGRTSKRHVIEFLDLRKGEKIE